MAHSSEAPGAQDPSQMRHFDSPVFGPARDATEEERALIERLVGDCPAAVFGAINRRLNRRDLRLAVDALAGERVLPSRSPAETQTQDHGHAAGTAVVEPRPDFALEVHLADGGKFIMVLCPDRVEELWTDPGPSPVGMLILGPRPPTEAEQRFYGAVRERIQVLDQELRKFGPGQ